MKTVCAADMCCGCNLCATVCKKDAIQIIDNIKSFNAIVDEVKCVDCGVCEKMCPVNEPIEKCSPLIWKQGWAIDDDIRKNSSSGGFAQAIQRAFVENGGVVCSCFFDNGEFVFGFASQVDELKKFVGSKYVKSDPKDVYCDIAEYLRNGTKVLFVGLPCQCAAARRCSKDNELLYTVDLICHGTPSPKLIQMFLAEKGCDVNAVSNVEFRQKTDFRVSVEGKSVDPESVRDRYTLAFLSSLCYTENCYSCQYACAERVSDLTLGDSWGSELDEKEQSKGISLVLCQTSKGQELLNMSDLYLAGVDLDNAVKNNRQLVAPSERPKEKAIFFTALHKTKNFNKSVKKCFWKICTRQNLKAILLKAGIIRR